MPGVTERESKARRVLTAAAGLAAGLALVAAVGPDRPVRAQTPAKANPAKAEAPAGPSASLEYRVAEVVKIIDEKLEAAWKANHVKPAEPCSDYEFIRRVSLDIIGRIAKPEEIDRFLKDPAATRRAQLVERLLKTEEYARNWANIWSTWLLTRSGAFGRGEYRAQTHAWLEDQFALNRPYNQLVTDLITATGSNKDNGAVNFILAHVGEALPPGKHAEDGQFEMVPITARITRLFLGIQTQCTQCHDHPFDSRKQSEFWGVNAFLRQVQRTGNPNPRRGQKPEELTLKDNPSFNKPGSVYFEKRNGVVLETQAVFLDGKKPQGGDRRAELAKFVVGHDNFAKAFVNRMWGHFFGKGFCNPVDDFNSQNQVAHPELLQALADRFKSHDADPKEAYDQKMLIRWVCNSKAYNLKSVTNPTNDKPEHDVLFSRMPLKALSPEQLFESLMVATQAEAAQTKEGKGKLREDWMQRLVANFGDDEGNEVSFNGTVVQALLMMNGEDINKAITDKGATVAKMLDRRLSNDANITHLYTVALNRPPTAQELKKVKEALRLPDPRHEKPGAAWHDLFWALLNSNEFMLNH